MIDKDILDQAGKRIVIFVRDNALIACDQLVNGTAKAPSYRELVNRLRQASPECRDLVRSVATEMVDTVLHNFLWMFEGGKPTLQIVLRTPDGETVDLAELTDGLGAEPFGPQGWIARFSEYPGSATSS